MSHNSNPANSPVSPAQTSPRWPKWDRFSKEKASFELDLETLLQAKENELTNAQTEIKGESAATDQKAKIGKRRIWLSSLMLVFSQS